VTQERIAEARCAIDQARLLTLKAAWMMEVAGNEAAKAEIAMIKVVAPNMACRVIDWAMQVHGGGGVSDDFPLAGFYACRRAVRCDRLGEAGAWRRRRLRRLPARQLLRRRAHAALCRRPGRGAPQRDRE